LIIKIVEVFLDKIMKNNLKMDYLETHNRVHCLVKVNFLFSKNLSLTNLISKKQNNKSHYLEYKNKSHYLHNPLKLQTNCQVQFSNHKLTR